MFLILFWQPLNFGNRVLQCVRHDRIIAYGMMQMYVRPYTNALPRVAAATAQGMPLAYPLPRSVEEQGLTNESFDRLRRNGFSMRYVGSGFFPVSSRSG